VFITSRIAFTWAGENAMVARRKSGKTPATRQNHQTAGKSQLIADYEWLRRFMHYLEVQAEAVDLQLRELECRLPNDYVFPGDALTR
jgi:hypothetical protein